MVVVELLGGHVDGFPPGVEGGRGGRKGGGRGGREAGREDVLGAFGFGGPAAGAFGLGRVVVELAFGAGPVPFVDGVGGTELAVCGWVGRKGGRGEGWRNELMDKERDYNKGHASGSSLERWVKAKDRMMMVRRQRGRERRNACLPFETDIPRNTNNRCRRRYSYVPKGGNAGEIPPRHVLKAAWGRHDR